MPPPPTSAAAARRASTPTVRTDAPLPAVLRRTHDAFRSAAARIRRGGDKEAIHDARVALRRARAVLRLWRADAPALDALVEKLRAQARALAAARDAEVACETLRGLASGCPPGIRTALSAHAAGLRRRREEARSAARDACAPARLRPLHRAWTAAAGGRGIPPGAETRLRARLQRAGRRLGRACPDPEAPPADWHAFRLRVKKCRYALECGREWGLTGNRAWAKRLAKIQNLLGEAHDLEMLRIGMAKGGGGTLPPEARAWLDRRIARGQRRRFVRAAKLAQKG
jgi:CHAD domain-containing protein